MVARVFVSFVRLLVVGGVVLGSITSTAAGDEPKPSAASQPEPTKTDTPQAAGAAQKTDTPDPEKQKPALNGYDLVSYQTTKQPQKGSANHQATYVGKLYYFAKESNKKIFEANPDRYLPQYAGMCTVALGNMGNRLAGDPEVYAVFDGKLYLFGSERAKRFYDSKPEAILNYADRVFATPMFQAYCPVSYQTQKAALQVGPTFRAVAHHRMFHIASDVALPLFQADPDRYIPQYMGRCPVAWLASNKRESGEPTIFSVVDGKTYLLHTTEAKQKFDADSAKYIKPADTKWARIKDMVLGLRTPAK